MINLLKSKRVWVLLVTVLLRAVITHYGYQLSSPDLTTAANNIVLAFSAAAIVGTKLMDANKIVGVITTRPPEPPVGYDITKKESD